MNIFNKKTIAILLAFLTSLTPTQADNKKEPEDGKEEPTTSYKLVLKFITPEQGEAELKGKLPMSMYTVIHYSFKAHEMKAFSSLYRSTTLDPTVEQIQTKGLQLTKSTTHIFSGDDTFKFEKVLASVKRFVGRLYIEQTDETDTQSRMAGIIGDCYDDSQVLGVGFKTEDIDVTLDLEGIVRALLYPADVDEQKKYKDNGTGFGSIKLKWQDWLDIFEEVTLAVKAAKGDFTPLGKNKGNFDVGKYLHSVKISLKPHEPFLDIVHKVTLSYTHIKSSLKENDKSEGKLRITPGFNLGIDCGDFSILGEDAALKLGFKYTFCDIQKEIVYGFTEPSLIYHLAFSFELKFKDFFGQKNLEFTPKLEAQWAPESTWNTKGVWYDRRVSKFSFQFKHTIPLADYYSL